MPTPIAIYAHQCVISDETHTTRLHKSEWDTTILVFSPIFNYIANCEQSLPSQMNSPPAGTGRL